MTRDHALDALFNARTVAVIGASSDPFKIGGRPISYMQAAGFDGTIVPVNPTQNEIAGLPTYASLADVEQEVDIALILVAGERVEQAVRDCVAKRVPAAVIFAAGFAELSDEGRAAEERIAALAREGDVRLLGPNCMGVMNFQSGMLGTFAGALSTGLPTPGRLAVASQSGAVGSHCVLLARERGLGLSKAITTGNEMDLDLADCLLALAGDPDTDAIIGYFEGTSSGPRMRKALEAVAASGKAVALLKGGASNVGATAALSHTASLAGADTVYEELLRRYGVHRATTIDELLACAYVFTATSVRPTSAAAEVLTAGITTGSLERQLSEGGLSVSRHEVDDLREAVGRTAAPVQIIAAGTDPELPDARQDGVVRIVWSQTSPRAKSRLESQGYLVMPDERWIAPALRALRTSGRPVTPAARSERDVDAARALVGPDMTEPEAMDLLDALGVPTPARAVVADAAAAVEAADRIGYPVVLKVVSPDIRHKSDVGGVALRLTDRASVAAAFHQVVASSRSAMPDARIDGVLISPMLHGGIEMIVGMQRDPVFGPVVICGVGGTLVEVFGDVALRVTPFTDTDPTTMLDELRATPALAEMLDGYDVEALSRLLAAFAASVHQLGEDLDSLEINPVLVLPEGQGCVAVDALVIGRPTADVAGGH